MHRRLIVTLLSCCLFYLPSKAQDSTVADSLSTAGTGTAEADSSVNDTQRAVSAVESSLLQDTALSSQLSDALVSTEVDENEKSANGTLSRRTMEMTKSSIQKILRTSFRYLKYFIVLVVSFGILLYTILFYRRRKDNERFLTSTRLSIMDREVQLACKYMEENFHDSDLTVESMCEVLITGPAFLEALFEKELGMSVSEFLSQVRINRAKSILNKNPEIETDEIALDVGFTDKNLFLQKFQEITGVTLEEYRNASQNSKQVL